MRFSVARWNRGLGLVSLVGEHGAMVHLHVHLNSDSYKDSRASASTSLVEFRFGIVVPC